MTTTDLFEKWAEGEACAVAKLIGMKLAILEEDRAVVEMEVGPQHANPMGSVHGGILCDLADAAMGTAWATGIERGESFTTVELKMNFFRPVWSGKLFAEGKVLRRGRTLGYVECDVRDSEKRLVAKGGSTCMTLRGGQAEGR